MILSKTPPIVRRGILQLKELRHKVIHDLLIKGVGSLFFLVAFFADIYNQLSITYRRLETRLLLFANSTFHSFHLLFNGLFRQLGQSKPLCILSHGFYFLNVYAQNLKSLISESVKKTCQVHFFQVVPSVNNPSLAFCSILLIFNPKIKLYQTVLKGGI